MANTVHTGWREITPGNCPDCGFDDDYECDGRGNVTCGCQACVDCGSRDVYGFHNAGCPQIEPDVTCDQCGKSLPEQVLAGGLLLCEDCHADNERVSAANLAYDAEQLRIANERFDRMAALLREAYPTRIPEEWTR